MTSLRAKCFVIALKYRDFLKFRSRRTTQIDWNTSIKELREEVENGANFFGKLPKNMHTDNLKIGNLALEWIFPSADAKVDKVILYFHGGGYVVGSINAHRGIVAKFVKATNLPALHFEYRLAPEHKFPAALDDSLAAYNYLLNKGYKGKDIVFIGDSGGGGLLLCTLMALKDKGIELPACAVAMSPWVDLTNSGESLTKNSQKDTLCWKDAQFVFSRYYVGEANPENPWISPIFGNFIGLPPVMLFVGSDELLLDDSVRYAQKAKEAGVDITLHIGNGLFHCYPACSPMFPEAKIAMEEIKKFVLINC